MPTEFVHLHLHTDYSLLDGACPIYRKAKNKIDIVKLALKNNMSAVAITDHGFMGGAIDFYQNLNNNGVKPIIGCEMYVSPTTLNDRTSDTPNIKGFHLILLAKDFKGYQNLCELNTIAHLQGHYYKPRIDKKILAEKSEGLIGLSACLHGEIQYNLLNGSIKNAKRALQEYLDILGKDNFYLEIMDHGIEDQKIANKQLISLSKEFGLPLVATNDVHYLEKEHAKSHELLLCIQTNTTIGDEKRFKFSSDQFYFKSGDEMLETFKEIPDAIKNTIAVAERCNVEIPFVPEVNHYPVYTIKNDSTPSPLEFSEGYDNQSGVYSQTEPLKTNTPGYVSEKDYLRNICLDGIKTRYDFDPHDKGKLTAEQKQILDRMEYELEVIDKSNYCSYFLVVWDFLKHAREIKVPVGPGRGSGAGSIVAYLAHITDIDPLKYQLLFERFLNPERVSPPDFDIDFCERRRSEIIDYVRNRYGAENVAQIGTYGTLKAKAVIKDIGRTLGYSFDQRNQITKLMSNDPELTLESSRENNTELNDLIKKEQWVEEIFKYSEPIESLNRNMSIHAAGVIIGDQPLKSLIPLSKGSNNEIITQYPAMPCENLGLLKMDFLGLRTLTIIQDTTDLIEQTKGAKIDISKIPLDDKNTFDLLNRGDTIAIFQLESDGMRELCKKFGINKIEDIIALIALYRPGPMQFIGDFINRKTGKIKLEYDHPKMEPVIKETYGIMLYQEQIIQVVQVLAGFTLGAADILRRAIGKKKADVLTAQKKKFIEGCAKHSNINEEKATTIWDKIEMFAGYGFNKSHSAAYAFLAYRTAYLKANYPVEFMTAVLTSELRNADKLTFFIKECKEMGIEILPPDINVSNASFTKDGNSIRFGLAAIKGVGDAASETIISSRTKHGNFKDLMDFAEKIGNSLTSRVLENLIRTGAFSSFKLRRSQLVQIMPKIMSLAQSRVKDREIGQGNLFDILANDNDSENTHSDNLDIDIPDIPEFPEHEMLKDEKELLGFYISGHPLGKYSEIIKQFSTHSVLVASTLKNETPVRVGGIITSLELKNSKKGNNKFGVFNLEDLQASIECIVFPQTYEKTKSLIEENKVIFVSGRTGSKEDTGTTKIIIDNLYDLQTSLELFSKEIHFRIYEASTNSQTLEELKNVCKNNPGKTAVIICLTCIDGEIAFIESGEQFNIKITEEIIHKLKLLLGEENVRLKPNLSLSDVTKTKSYRT